MDDLPARLPANVERFSGFAGRYDAYRPTPPAIIVDILTQLAAGSRRNGVTRPKLVAISAIPRRSRSTTSRWEMPSGWSVSF
jgi:hypothetical protein